MPLMLERLDGDYRLRSANGSVALVNDRRLVRSFIVSVQQLIEDWEARDASTLTFDALAPLLALSPEVILLGTGHTQVFPPQATLAACLGRGIGLEAMTNAAAARTFNVLASEGRNVVAGLVMAT